MKQKTKQHFTVNICVCMWVLKKYSRVDRDGMVLIFVPHSGSII